MLDRSVAPEIIPITALGKPVESGSVEGVDSAGGTLAVAFSMLSCSFLSGSGKVQKVVRGRASDQQHGQSYRKSPLCFLPWLA